VFVRVITLLLAVFVMTAAAVPDGFVCPDSVQAADDGGDLDTPVMPTATVPSPVVRSTIAPPLAPRVSRGRTHATKLFRPPRLVASR